MNGGDDDEPAITDPKTNPPTLDPYGNGVDDLKRFDPPFE